jgi:hypothetical protein
MSFQDLVSAAKKYFPNLQIKYKDESRIMRLISKLLIFNKGFMTEYTTTVGDTIYFPSKTFIKCHPVSSSVILLHELVHLHDQKCIGRIAFIFSYLFPQILVPVCLLMLLLVSWKIILPLTIMCCLPIPAIFRTHWEKRAYLSSFYVMQVLGNRMKFNPHLRTQENIFLKYFHGASYYFMWPFHDIDKQFDIARDDAIMGRKPFEDPVFDMLDDLSTKV